MIDLNDPAAVAFLRPFILLIFFMFIVYPITWLINKILPEGKIKRFLNKRIN
jgi:hypothetical protein